MERRNAARMSGLLGYLNRVGDASPIDATVPAQGAGTFDLTTVSTAVNVAENYTLQTMPDGSVQLVPKNPPPSAPAWLVPLGIAAIAIFALS